MAANGFSDIQLCEGKDSWKYRVFLHSNEDCQEETLQMLSEKPVAGNTAVGVSGFFLLDAVAARSDKGSSTIENIVLIDCSLRIEHFWKEMERIMGESSVRMEVIDKVRGLLENEKERYFCGSSCRDPAEVAKSEVAHFDKGVTEGRSWLSKDENFEKIKKIFDAKKFVFLRMDLVDTSSIGVLCEVLKSQSLSVDMLYASNVTDLRYVRSFANLRVLEANLEQLSTPETLCIRSKLFLSRLTQHVSQKSLSKTD
ncbi:MAG: hypothetical protein V4492_07640 [Chlamydiota bacterium]